MTYSIIGDDSSPVYFAINKDSGRITLKSSVNGDEQTQYKVTWALTANVHKIIADRKSEKKKNVKKGEFWVEPFM